MDPRLIRYEGAVDILAAIEAAGPTLKYAQNLNPRDKWAPEPEIYDATFKTNLGVWGRAQKPQVLQFVAGPQISWCGALSEFPGDKRDFPNFFVLYQSVWDSYNVPAFTFEGTVSCGHPSHGPHAAIATFKGLELGDLKSRPFPTPEETRLFAPRPVSPRPVPTVKPKERRSAEEVLREAVRADAR